MTSTRTPAIDDRVALAIRQQIEILELHASRDEEWSPTFLREHAMMIVQMAESATYGREGFGPSRAGLL